MTFTDGMKPKSTWGGKRVGAGRPRAKRAQRCVCGANTLKRAEARGFECCKANGKVK